MALAARTRLGPYEIQSLIGAGGMGEVYKARDTRLDRTVAIKVLPPEVASDPERRARFEREARTVAALNHAHICALFDVGDHDGSMFLVMEHVAGETLAERLRNGPVALDQALAIAAEIAEALSVAHRQGVIHRDLKPGNVILAKSGAKLLDFGLAKLAAQATAVTSAALSAAPTQEPATSAGTILGTVQYMAPEQLEGQDADARSDIFSFGAVLYEMITGRRAFEGQSAVSVMAAILHRDPPPIASLQPVTPPALDHLVRRCLAKAPDDRPDTAHDIADQLRWLQTGLGVASTEPHPPQRRRRTAALLVAAALLFAALGAAAVWGLRPPPAPALVVRTFAGVAPADRLQSLPVDASSGEQRPSYPAIALSPDGRLLVFSAVKDGRQQLYARRMDRLDATPIEHSEGAANPFFSFDGGWIGFWANAALKKIPVSGGPATTICATPPIVGASWGDDNAIVFARTRGGLLRVPAGGGTPAPLTTLDERKGEVSHRLPFVLPGARAVLFTAITHYLPNWDEAQIVLQPLPGGPRRTLARGADARYVPSGHLLFMRSGSLVVTPFDLRRMEPTGGEVVVLDGIMQAVYTVSAATETGAGQFATSASGLLAYCTGGIFPEREHQLMWVDRAGKSEPLPLPTGSYMGPHLSPDGQQLLFWTMGRERVVWVYDLRRGTRTRVTTEGRNSRAIWTADGRRAVFTNPSGGVDWIAAKTADGTGEVERLGAHGLPSSYAPDGTLAFVEQAADRYAIWVLPPGTANASPLLDSKAAEASPEFSPDGRAIAYVSAQSGRNEVYVQPYPGPGPRQQISNDGGGQPAWSRDGRELFYTAINAAAGRVRMMSVPLSPGPRLNPGIPRLLFEGAFRWQSETRGYDVTPDGQRFLMVQRKERPAFPVTQIMLVQNWFEELKAKVPVAR